MPHRHIPENWPKRNSRFGRFIGRLLLKLLGGWQISGPIPEQPKLVLAVAPHTANKDFFIGIAAVLALDIKVSFLGKHSIFVWPVRGLLLRLGGIAVDRSAAHGVVGQVVERFAQSDAMLLGLAPEGTRKKVTQWKSGFWQIAKQAKVPVALIGLDYSSRQVRFGPCLETGETFEQDMQLYRAFFQQITARYPENA
ncbi:MULTISPECIES: 1-acyl-sn-glycerol-3-phosphate acyltransferase [Rheinheimera]|uniref:1-acyl-sn-glycerol-3-phosphate acyltransferase n=1 Tax=Rheinheimera marina TaxID=1774958 RepID=A0ABV9JKU5_9GAMM